MTVDSLTREILPCTVIAHLPFGLLVELENHEKGIVRIRETSWDAAQRSAWKQLFPIGMKVNTLLIKRPAGRYIELSLRLVEGDPWEHINERIHEGQVVTGVVMGVKHYGVFVEIQPGLTGLLHQSRLPAWCKKSVMDLFWPGDQVRVQVAGIDCKEKQISLASVPVAIPGRVVENRAKPVIVPSSRQPFEQLLKQELRRSILIVEDEAEQGKEIEDWLTNLDQRVRWVVSAEEGLLQIEKDPPDLLVTDLSLPGMNGVDLIHAVRERWPGVRCVLCSGWTRLEEDLQRIESLQREGVLTLFKPLLPDDLLDLLLLEVPSAPEADTPGLNMSEPALPDLQRSSFQGGLRKLLHHCLVETEFAMAVLFRLDPVHRLVEVLYQAGDLPGVQPFLDDLIYSPVRDVAEDGDQVRIENMADGSHDARFRYLLPAYPFTACVGVKVPNKLNQEYALFLFDARAREIFDDEMAYTQATALAVGSLLERQMLTNQLRATQKMTMLGHLSSFLAHELNHGLSPLNNSVRNLSVELDNLAAAYKQNPAQMERELAFTQDLLKDVRRSVLNLSTTVRAFRDLLSVGKKQIVNLDELVMETLTMLQQTSLVSRVKLDFQPGESLTAIRSQMPLLQHVLLNLLMNAIEQISEIRPVEGGQVSIRVERAQADSGDVLRLLVEDNGPGIHWRLWDRIFDPGFTTRNEGSGLGLFISRNIVESLGGRLYVAESYMINGTVFAVELPYQI